MDKPDKLATEIARVLPDYRQKLIDGAHFEVAIAIATAVRSFMGSDEAVARACAAAIPEPEHLYVGRDEAYRSDMQRAVTVERLVFETKLRDALPAILQSPDA